MRLVLLIFNISLYFDMRCDLIFFSPIYSCQQLECLLEDPDSHIKLSGKSHESSRPRGSWYERVIGSFTPSFVDDKIQPKKLENGQNQEKERETKVVRTRST
jgi:hypothetical protein